MLNTSAVAPLPRASSYATAAYSAKPAPGPPSRAGTISPNRPGIAAGRRSRRRETCPSRSCSAARAANRGANRRAAPSASTAIPAPSARDPTGPTVCLPALHPTPLVEHGGRPGRHDPAERPARRASRQGQPAQQPRHRRTDAPDPQRHAVPGALRRPAPARRRTASGRGCPGARRAAAPPRVTASSRLSAVSLSVSSTSSAARPQHPAQLGHRRRAGRGRARASRRRPPRRRTPSAERQRGGVAVDRRDAVRGRLLQRRTGAGPPRRAGNRDPRTCGASRPPPQPDVDQHRPGAGRRRHQSRPAPRPASAASRRRRPAATTRRPDRRTDAGSLRAAGPVAPACAHLEHSAWVEPGTTAGNEQTSSMSRTVVRRWSGPVHPEPAVAVTGVIDAARRGGRAPAPPASPAVAAAIARQPARGRLGQRLARRRPGPGGRAARQAGGHRRGEPPCGRPRGLDRRARHPGAGAAVRLRPRRSASALALRLRAALRLAAEVRPRSPCCRTRSRSGCCRRSSCSPCPATGPARPGWSRRVRCSAPARTSRTCCPTWTTTPRTGVRGLPHRIGPAGSRVAAAGAAARRDRRRWCSARPGRRRGPGWRRSRPPSWSCPLGWYAGRAAAAEAAGRWRCSGR